MSVVNNESVNKWDWKINNLNTYNTQNINTAFDTGLTKISLNVESNFGCKSLNFDSSIYVHRKPNLQLKLNDSCINKSIYYLVQDTFNLVNDWHWNFGNGYYKAGNATTKMFNQAGANPFAIIGITSKSCSDTIVRNFRIYDNVAFAGNDTTVAMDQPVYLNANGYADEKYLWTPSRGLDNDTVENPTATFYRDQLYKLHSVTKEGCVKDSKVFIKRYQGPAIYVATIFTPNKDGKNDVLHAFPVGITEFYHFSIFNRLGKLIFTTKDVSKGWDGTYNGQLLANETFVVVAEAMDYKGRTLQYKGTVVLMR